MALRGLNGLLLIVLFLAMGCSKENPNPMAAKFKEVQLKMSLADVSKILGEGMEVTQAQFQAQLQGQAIELPATAKYFRWGEGYPRLLVAFVDDKVALTNQVLVAKK